MSNSRSPFFNTFDASYVMFHDGAENTNKQWLTAPDISGLFISATAAGGSKEYKTRQAGNTYWPTVCGFFSHPAHTRHNSGLASPQIIPGLKSRSKQKGVTAMCSNLKHTAPKNRGAK